MGLKNRERVSTTLPNDLAKKLKDYSHKTYIPVTKLVEKAVEKYFNEGQLS